MLNKWYQDRYEYVLTHSAPQDVTNVIKTRSRLKVWVGIGLIHISWIFDFFHGSMKKFNQLAKKKKKKKN